MVKCRCGCGESFAPSKATLCRIRRGDPVGYIKSHVSRKQQNPRWKGGKAMKDGYRLVTRPDHPNARQQGYILEHRLVMSEALGRPLKPNEIVHHKNENKLDNSLDNLEMTTRKDHRIMHDPNSGRRLPPKNCPTCGKSFKKNTCHRRTTFCSRKCIQGIAPKGEQHPCATLTENLVRQIRVRGASGETHQKIADDLGLNRRNVSRVIQRVRWQHVI